MDGRKSPEDEPRENRVWPQLHDTGFITHRIAFCIGWGGGGFSYTTSRQSGVTPLRFRGVKPLRFGGEVKINPIHSAPHSISCNCTNPMWFHSSWASQLLKTIDLDIAVQIDSVSCNCNQKWVHVNTVSCNCNENSVISKYNTRKIDDFEIPRLRLEYCKKSFGYQGASAWNEIPKQIRDSASLSSFKVRLREFLR